MVAAVHLLNLLLSTTAIETGRKPTVEVPILKTPSQIVIGMKIGGKEGKFVLDTGSFEVRIQRSSAERMGLVSVSPPDQKFIYDKIHQWLKPVIEIGGVEFGKQDVVVKPMYFDAAGNSIDYKDYDGTVGTEFMRKHAWGFDLMDRRIAIWKGGKVSPTDAQAWVGAGFASSALTTDGPGDWYRVYGSLNGHPIPFVLDTGAPFTLVMKDKEEHYGFSSIGPSNLMFLDASRPGSIGLGTTMVTVWRRRNLPLAALIDSASLPLFKELKTDAVIGYDSFQNTRTLFDFPAMNFMTRLDPEAAKWSNHLGSFGFRLAYTGDKASVIVKSGSRAEKAGLKMGDVIEEIDGVPTNFNTETTPPPNWQPGSKMILKIRRGEETLNLTLERELPPN